MTLKKNYILYRNVLSKFINNVTNFFYFNKISRTGNNLKNMRMC